MKRLLSAILLVVAFFCISFTPPALADGAQIFSAKCAQCHLGGKNLVNPAKSLSKADLGKYEMDSVKAIVTQVTNGKGAMPSFKALLKPEQIEEVAAYVLAQADKSWAK